MSRRIFADFILCLALSVALLATSNRGDTGWILGLVFAAMGLLCAVLCLIHADWKKQS